MIQLKLVSFSSKGYKKELIVSYEQVILLRTYLVNMIKCDVLVINTNIGLDVYYNSIENNKAHIENAFIILLAKGGKIITDYYTSDINSIDEVRAKSHQYFKRLINHPLLFKSYAKSMCYQINLNYAENSKLIESLFSIWQDELLRLNDTDVQVYILRTFLSNLQLTYIQQSCKPELQDLLRAALDQKHCN
ncbi:conserved hypothetical protein [Formosa agariphila KMM 3901]|uniref:Uncharacterized protein n=1 Tax=Formosa agariphila (strain DSM 15362 / KCTC 12365 / LMG 23005 / KMM 3901 / M-2Alg 35-1) TaxID=1347342 RepID=T2KHT6_FORAG|nr:hypothetical protein [Formosa agariphila]CDF78412.1 conserved hypothetical protein [Formosa agariphila KMM 3901]